MLFRSESLRINEVPWYNPEKAYALADMVITLSESDKAWWNALGFRTEKVVNPLTFDNNICTTATGNGNNVIWVGRINDDVKQFREAILIIKEVHHKNPKVVLHVIGTTEPPELLDQLQEKLRREGFAEYVVFHEAADDGGVALDFAESFFVGLFVVTDNVEFVEEFEDTGGDFLGDLGFDGEENDRARGGGHEQDTDKGGGVGDVREDEAGAKDEGQETENDVGELERNKGDDGDHGGVFAVDMAVFVHVVNLERLATDGRRRDVVIIAAEEDGLSGEFEVFFLGEVVDEDVVFVNVAAQGANEGDDGQK